MRRVAVDDERSRLAAEWDAVAAAPPPAPSSSSSSSPRKTAITVAIAVEAAAAPAVDDFTRITYADALKVLSAMDLSAHAHAITVRDDRAAGLPHASPSLTHSPTPLPPSHSPPRLSLP